MSATMSFSKFESCRKSAPACCNSEITRSLASETLQFEQSLREQLLSQRQMLALTGWIMDVNDPGHAPQLARLLQTFVENNPDILYVTAVNKDAKGPSAGSISADRDPFVGTPWHKHVRARLERVPTP